MPRIQPTNSTSITNRDDEGTVIIDIDPISLLFWERNVTLKTAFETHLLEEDFLFFDEEDMDEREEREESGVNLGKEPDLGGNLVGGDDDSEGAERAKIDGQDSGKERKRASTSNRMGLGSSWAASFTMGGDTTERYCEYQRQMMIGSGDSSQSGGSERAAENMSSVGNGTEEEGEDGGSVNKSSEAKKAKLSPDGEGEGVWQSGKGGQWDIAKDELAGECTATIIDVAIGEAGW